MKTFHLLFLLACLLLPGGISAQREAFPGAEGYGRMTTGGRGGKVYHVTTLEDTDAEGSFRWACNQSGARTIVFDVSGTIYLKSDLSLRNGNVTIAGQTAPGDGICIADYPFTISANNVIIRFMRFRLGNRQVAYHEGDGLGGMDNSNIIVDHCSVSWSIDECLSVYGSKNITVQWCIVSHSLVNSGHSKGAHGYGGNWGGSGASYHHNLVANHGSRTPRLGPRQSTQTDERMDFRNNVIYNYGSNGCYGGEGMNVNMVNNYYKPGSTSNSRKSRIAGPGIRTVDYCLDKNTTVANYNKVAGTNYTSGNVSGSGSLTANKVSIGGKSFEIDMTDSTIDVNGTKVKVAWNGWAPMLHKWGTFYVKGNYNPQDATVTADNWTTGIYSQITPSSNDNIWNDQIKQDIKLDTPIEYVYTTTHSAEKAFEKVLAYAGASLHRDEYDVKITSDARTGSATFTSSGLIDSQDQCVYASGAKGWPSLKSEAAPKDTDGDGMPDAWETANGLDPNNAADGNTKVEGWTNLERYINSLVDDVMVNGNADGKLLTANLEDTDPAVTLPEYNGENDDPVTGDDYVISSETFIDSNPATTWTFANGISVTNSNGKGYGKGNAPYIKYSNGTQYTVHLPEGLIISSLTIEGYCNYDNATAYFSEVNGENTKDIFVFPSKTEIASHSYTLATPAKGSFTISAGGSQPVVAITLHTGSTAIEEVVIPTTDNADTRIFNLMGVEMPSGATLTPGIYIRGGKKFIVK